MRNVHKTQIAHIIQDIIDSHQFAYKECHNTIMPLIKGQHSSMKRLENGARILAKTLATHVVITSFFSSL